MNCKHVSYHFIPLLFSGLSFLAHGQGQSEGAQLLVTWKAGAHFRVCDSVPPIDLLGNSLEWNAKTGGVWEANPREDGRTVLSVSTRERPDCSGAISETGQFYPALSSRDSLPESKLPDDIRALMLRLSHRKPQDKQSDSSKSSTSSWLSLGDFGKKATAAAPALLALGGWGGFFNQFPPRPPFPGFPGQESKSLATSTTVMLLLLMAQGLLPFPDDSQQSFIFIDINGDSVALSQDDLQWLERFRQNPDFHSLLDIRVKETLFPGAEYEYEQYEAEQRKRQAMLTLAVWLTKMEVALNHSMDSLETDESDIVKPERPADTSSTSERALPGIISMMFSSKRTSPPDTQGESSSSGSQSHASSGLPQRRPNSVNRDDAGDDGASPPKINLACPSCSQLFPTELDLKAHIKSEHGEAENIERHGVSVPLKTMEVAAADEQPKSKKTNVVSLSIPQGVLGSVSYMDANDRKSYVVEIQPADSVVHHGQLVTTDPKIAKSILISKMVDGVRKALKTYESNPSDKAANRLKEDIAYWEEVHANELSDDVQVQTFLNVLHKLVINIATSETDQKSEYEDEDEDASICTPFISSMHPDHDSMEPGDVVDEFLEVFKRLGISPGEEDVMESSSDDDLGFGLFPCCSSSLTLTAGGAQDNEHFTQLVAQGEVPSESEFSFEGCFSEFDLRLDLPKTRNTVAIHPAVAIDLDSRNLFLQMSLYSVITEEGFQRKPLNLSVVLDISDSMSDTDNTKFSRLTWAKLAILRVLKTMTTFHQDTGSQDRLSIVLFNNKATVFLKPDFLSNYNEIFEGIARLKARGYTNLYRGLEKGFELVQKHFDDARENRVILITDAGANLGNISPNTNHEMVSRYAEDGIGLTVIAIGSTLDDKLVKAVSEAKGGNYVFLQSPKKLNKLFSQFNFLVSPVAYDVQASMINIPGYRFKQAYGIPSSEDMAGEGFLSINTLFFASAYEGGGILLKYEPENPEN